MSNSMARRPFPPAYIYLLMALTGYMLADLVILNFRGDLTQQKPPPTPAPIARHHSVANVDYSIIKSRNIFNLDGKIPEPIGGQAPTQVDPEPVRSTISGLVLVGTLVHANPHKSIASVKTAQSADRVAAFRVGDIIDNVGELLEVTRGKIVYRNSVSKFREFIELPQEAKINLGLASKTAAPAARQDGEVTVISDTERSIKREDVNNALKNFNDLLMQARAVQEGNAFRIVDIQPGSIYERLGIKRGDLIKSVNGEPVDSQQKAMELYNGLKNSGAISLGIERNGRDETINFTIN